MKHRRVPGGSTLALASAALCILAAAPVAWTQSRPQPQPVPQWVSGSTYKWSGELMSVDPNAHTITVKSMVVGDAVPKQLEALKPGDRIVLSWSGFYDYASGVNGAVPYASAKQKSKDYAFPAEFLSFDADHDDVTFTVTVPADAMAGIAQLKPGHWITARSPHGKKSEMTPIVSLRPYQGG